MSKELFTVLVEIKGEAESYESAGHGVKHRIMDVMMSAGFKEENVKIVSIRKEKIRFTPKTSINSSQNMSCDEEVDDMVDILFNQSEVSSFDEINYGEY